MVWHVVVCNVRMCAFAAMRNEDLHKLDWDHIEMKQDGYGLVQMYGHLDGDGKSVKGRPVCVFGVWVGCVFVIACTAVCRGEDVASKHDAPRGKVPANSPVRFRRSSSTACLLHHPQEQIYTAANGVRCACCPWKSCGEETASAKL